jgi:hypothetical protein
VKLLLHRCDLCNAFPAVERIAGNRLCGECLAQDEERRRNDDSEARTIPV